MAHLLAQVLHSPQPNPATTLRDPVPNKSSSYKPTYTKHMRFTQQTLHRLAYLAPGNARDTQVQSGFESMVKVRTIHEAWILLGGRRA